MTADGTPREREKALRELLALIADAAVVAQPAVPEPFDFEKYRADERAYRNVEHGRLLQIEGAARYAAAHGLGGIQAATTVLKEHTAKSLPYEPHADREAGS